MSNRFRVPSGVVAAAAILFVALAAFLLPLNVAHLSLLALAVRAPLPGEARSVVTSESVPALIRWMPLAALTERTRAQALWSSARYARLREYTGQTSREVGCRWDSGLCRAHAQTTRLAAPGHRLLSDALAAGAVAAHSRLDAEVALLSCLEATSHAGGEDLRQSCGERLAAMWPELASALVSRVPVVGVYVPELSDVSARPLAQGTVNPAFGCAAGLEFLRSWVRSSGFGAGQLGASRALASRCPSVEEIRFYHARAADLAGLADEAKSEYEASGTQHHAEAAYWLSDFKSRTDPTSAVSVTPCDTATALLEESSLPARREDGTTLGADSIVDDSRAADGRARVSDRFGTVLAHGPYVSLPQGKYVVRFIVQSGGASPAGRVLRLDVRQDAAGWRSELTSRVLREQDLPDARYEHVDVPFVSTGEGTVSFAVVALTTSDTRFDRLEYRREGCR